MRTYYVKQNMCSFRNLYTIYDDRKNRIMEIQGSKGLITIERIIGNFINIKYNLKGYGLLENEIFSISKKTGKIFKEFEVKFGKEVLEVSQERKLVSKPRLKVLFRNKVYNIEGNIMAREFNIFNENFKVCGSIYKKKLKVNDFYEVNISEEDFGDLGIAICLVIDCCFSI